MTPRAIVALLLCAALAASHVGALTTATHKPKKAAPRCAALTKTVRIGKSARTFKLPSCTNATAAATPTGAALLTTLTLTPTIVPRRHSPLTTKNPKPYYCSPPAQPCSQPQPLLLLPTGAALLTNPKPYYCSPPTQSCQRAAAPVLAPDHMPPVPPSHQALDNVDHSWIIPVEQLHLLNKIGEGSFGEVYRSRWNSTMVAAKKLPTTVVNSPEEFKQFLSSIKVRPVNLN